LAGKKGAKKAGRFSDAEKAAMKERVREMKGGKTEGEGAVLAKIAEMPPADRKMAERLHAIIRANAPGLTPRTWYGMPAYANDGKVVCFFRGASKFKERYMTLGFNEDAKLDEGNMWAVAFAVTGLSAADEEKIAGLVRKAVG